ncbi:MAG: hypothetical protein ABI416_02710 [Ginsengibacter sp.]
MNITVSIRLKAALLFVVFASNTALGVACTIGVDKALIKSILQHAGVMSNAGSCSNEQADASRHGHSDGKLLEKNCRCDKEEDRCCNKKVISFEQLDNAITQAVTPNFIAPVFDLPPFLTLSSTLHSGTSVTSLNFIFLNFHSPPEDIRLSIRSFQI